MMDYYRKRNSELFEQKDKTKFNVFDMKFGLGPLEKVFGPGGVQLKTQGSVQVKMGVKSNKTDNPALPASARRKTYFDFDQKNTGYNRCFGGRQVEIQYDLQH